MPCIAPFLVPISSPFLILYMGQIRGQLRGTIIVDNVICIPMINFHFFVPFNVAIRRTIGGIEFSMRIIQVCIGNH